MNSAKLHASLLLAFGLATAPAFAANTVASADALAAIDLNRGAIIADIAKGFDGDRAALAKRLAALRADRLLAASLASTRESLETILAEAEKSRDNAAQRAVAKNLGSPNADLVYTPLSPCRLIDTRGFGAPIQGGPFAPNERRAYTPNGLCNLPVTGVATIMVSFTTQNLTPASGGILAMLAPNAPVNTTVDIFNVGSEWSASNTVVATGGAAQFDVFVSQANAQLVVDVLGYFAPPQGVVGGGGIIAVSASAPLVSSGGATPNISLAGAIPVANGGTGQTTFTPNGILVGQGAGAVAASVGTAGQVLNATAGAPVWSDSLTINGSINLVDKSTATAGNIFKGGMPFLHDFGDGNTFVGARAGNFTMAGISNTALGEAVLTSLTTGSSNTGVGEGALAQNRAGSDNTAIGASALGRGNNAVRNTAVGSNALKFSSGGSNTATGAFALGNNSVGIQNTAVGVNALLSNTGGSNNTAVGLEALEDNTIGVTNVAVGAGALSFNTSGNNNNAIGGGAMLFNTIGDRNVAIGDLVMLNNTGGNLNVAIGANALGQNTTGSHNIALGINAGNAQTTGNFNIAIGNVGVAAEAGTIRIGDVNQNRTFVSGIRGATTGSADAVAVFIDSNGQLGTLNSSGRFKDDVADMSASSSDLMKLRPVTFHYKSDQGPKGRTLQYGLIAEEVAKVYPGLVAHSPDGRIETVMYQYLPAMLLNEFQKLQRIVETQAAEIAALKELARH